MRISRFKGLSDLVGEYGCTACSQLTPKERIYGLGICAKCMICVGPDAKQIIDSLSDDRQERRVQLSMAIGATCDFAKRLSAQEALAHNADVSELLRDMCNALDLNIMPTSGAIQ